VIEVEIKVRITDSDEMRKLFEENGGVYKISLNHEDTYFNMPPGLRDFKKTDEALRIRKSISYNKNKMESNPLTKFFLTYKGKKMDSITKTRREMEIQVEDGESLRELLKILEFKEIFTVKKERELYEFMYKDHKIEALIDYLPILKEYFIEVEYLTESSEKIDEAREILFEFLSTLNISRDVSITKSYLELIADRFKSKVRKKS